MDEKQKAYIVGLVIGVVLMALFWGISDTKKKYKMNLKCIQGELYEEIRPKFYVKSHLDCFEERTF